MLKEPGHLHNLYVGQWKFGRASRIYITLVRWASRLEMLISTPESWEQEETDPVNVSKSLGHTMRL